MITPPETYFRIKIKSEREPNQDDIETRITTLNKSETNKRHQADHYNKAAPPVIWALEIRKITIPDLITQHKPSRNSEKNKTKCPHCGAINLNRTAMMATKHDGEFITFGGRKRKGESNDSSAWRSPPAMRKDEEGRRGRFPKIPGVDEDSVRPLPYRPKFPVAKHWQPARPVKNPRKPMFRFARQRNAGRKWMEWDRFQVSTLGQLGTYRTT